MRVCQNGLTVGGIFLVFNPEGMNTIMPALGDMIFCGTIFSMRFWVESGGGFNN